MSMSLSSKPDFEQVRQAWTHYWHGELYLGRPLVVSQCAKPGAPPLAVDDNPHARRYQRAVTGDWEAQLRRLDRWLEGTEFLCEAVPHFSPDFGPDQMAAFCGAPLHYSEDSPDTNWVEPIVADWADFEVRLEPGNRHWQGILDYSRKLAAHSRGRYVVGVCDLHGNGDLLSALRSPSALCLDFYDAPELVARRMLEGRRLFPVVYDALHQAGGMDAETGSIGWIPFWCEGKFASLQCDFICMVSPEIGKEFIIPALAEEAAFVDHCVYHLDGPGALPHLDNILAIPDIDVVQWVSGAGQKPMWQWLEVLKRCQAAGKGLQIYDITIEQAKVLHRELNPVGLVYCVGGGRDEVLRFADWLVKHT